MTTTSNKKGVLIFVALLAICAAVGFFTADGGSRHYNSPYASGEKNVAVLNVVGTISPDDGATYNQQWILDTIDDIMWDQDNQGLILFIDSPGGYVYDIDEAYLKLMDYKERTGRPVLAAMGSMAASGGYYIAASADEIYANRNTLTGSIGVIMGSSIDLTGLFEKYGIKVTTIHSGKNKNMFGYDEPVSEEQRAIMQSLADEAYEQFVGIVAESRTMTLAEATVLADGRLYTAKQALANGLLDGIANLDETENRMMDILGVYSMTFNYHSYEPDYAYLKKWFGLTGLYKTSPQEALLEKALLPLTGGPAYYCATGWQPR